MRLSTNAWRQRAAALLVSRARTTVAGMPSARAACATASPALPPEEDTRRCAPAAAAAWQAAPMPRSLNEPHGCSASSFRNTGAPVPSAAVSGLESTSGVVTCSGACNGGEAAAAAHMARLRGGARASARGGARSARSAGMREQEERSVWRDVN
jgi:hypothetical protein